MIVLYRNRERWPDAGMASPADCRYHKPVEILTRGRGPGPKNKLIRFQDGLLVVTTWAKAW